MEVSNEILWLSAGVILVILEFTALSGIGLLFAGIGALVAGIAVQFAPDLSIAWQWIVFLGTTSLSALLLFKPLKNYSKAKGQYNDMIGHKAVIIAAIEPGQEGKARWSGTIMKARNHGHATLAENAEATITAVEGNILIVK